MTRVDLFPTQSETDGLFVAVVRQVRCWRDDEFVPLELDASRLAEGGEAWVPVTTPSGPGRLTWTNSD